MSTKTIVWVVVVIVVALGAWYFLQGGNASDMSGNPAMGGPGSGMGTVQSDSSSSGASGSSADLSSGLSQLDAQLDATANASASVDQGMNDQPIQQTE